MPADEVRAHLLRVLEATPAGAKRQLAFALGFRGKWALQTARGIGLGRTRLVEAVRRRLSRLLPRLEHGDLDFLPTGRGPGYRLFTAVWRGQTASRVAGVPAGSRGATT